MENLFERQTPPRVTHFFSTLILLILLPLLIMGVFQSVQVLTRALGTPADIIVNANIPLEPINTDYMNAFAQGGEEATDMIAPIIPEIRPLKPQVIRVDHIYDYYNVVSKSNNTLTFDFTRLDQVVNSIRSTGATPILSLSYMPSAIAQNGNIISPPTDWNEWSTVVQRTIEQYSGKSNKNLSGVYYEVWNEPDLASFGSWTLNGPKSYLTLYRYAALGAQKAQNVNQFYIGGPSTTGLYKNWILALIQSGSRIDFFSWHSYLADPKQFAEDQRTIASLIAPYPQYAFLPKLITEAGFTGNKDTRYNTMYAAAHTAAVFRYTATAKPTYLLSFQLKDGPNQTNGWGLLGHESTGKTRKPRYYVYPFLEAMKGTRLELLGEGSWVSALATSDDTTIRLLLVNFNHQNSKSENVPITFNNINPGNYTYRETFLLGRKVEFTEVVNDSQLKKELFMPANSVAIVELQKIDDSL